MAASSKPSGSFRVPNSIIQGLTTATMSDMTAEPGLNRLSAFQMVTLLGLLTRVSPKLAKEEVRSTVSEISTIIEVSRQVAHAVDREWSTADGEVKHKRYQALRRSPKHLRMIHEALLVLHGKTLMLRRTDASNSRRVTERVVHLLDSFGYIYERDGKEIDLHDLPPGSDKINVGTPERPVWRVVQLNANGEHFDRPVGILFRLNTELANELNNERGTIGFTLMARKVFALFKKHMKMPAALRLIILILRQTGEDFMRRLRQVIDDLGFVADHPQRAMKQLDKVLTSLSEVRLVRGFVIDEEADVLRVELNREWYKEEFATGTV